MIAPVAFAALTLLTSLPQSPDCQVAGTVLDLSGAPVPAAVVVFESASGSVKKTTGADGRVCADGLAAGDVTVRVAAPGFAETVATLRVAAAGAAIPLRVVLAPAPLAETVTVTASRSPARFPSPASASVLTSAVLLSSAAATLDDALKSVPGFSLFRRSSSRVANPTAQGATLRGLSASGASRTRVLTDGLPLNDPFGGWVHWNRVPVAAIDRVEVVRGGSSDLYGSDALGGVIQVLTFDGTRRGARGLFEAGEHGTARASLYAGTQARAWQGAAAAEWAATDGYPIVAEAERGPIDRPAASRHKSGLISIAWQRDPRLRLAARANVFTEARRNGTPLQRNDTNARRGAIEASGAAGRGVWSVAAFGGTQGYNQTFTAVSGDRTSERLTTAQHVPADEVGLTAQWAGARSGRDLLVGVEGRQVTGESRETRYFAGVAQPPQAFGGRERTGSIFAQMAWRATDRLTVVGGSRAEVWESKGSGGGVLQRKGMFAPRAAVSWRAAPGISVRGSAYAGFRAPTLNELFRGFRVGNTVTTANAALTPERARGAEGGVLVARGRWSARAIGFWTDLRDAIANVTLSVEPTLVSRQRRNAGHVHAAGVELETEFRASPALTLTVSAAALRSRFADVVEPELEGNRVPQVPSYQLAAGVRYAAPAFTVTADLRALGGQFEDDRNQLRLEPSALVDALVERRLGRGARVFAAIENLFDAEQQVGRTPITNVGLPRSFRAGVRIFLP
jgi:outer membrane receptor protein involved in Fe transport